MKYYILMIGMLFLLAGCGKENGLEPSFLEEEWFVIKDNPDDPLRHAVYNVYSEWGVPVFYNDTIGRQDRGIDRTGNPVTFYRLLDLN